MQDFHYSIKIFSCFVCCLLLGIEPKFSHMLGEHSTTKLCTPPVFSNVYYYYLFFSLTGSETYFSISKCIPIFCPFFDFQANFIVISQYTKKCKNPQYRDKTQAMTFLVGGRNNPVKTIIYINLCCILGLFSGQIPQSGNLV